MQDQIASNNLIKIWDWLRWQRLIGLFLIITGLILVSSFVKPYIYFAFGPTPLEASHSLKEADNRIFIPSIKLSAPLFEDVNQFDHGIIFPYGVSLNKKGNTVLEGHNLAKHGPLFSLLYLVRVDDEIVLHYQGKRYAYWVKEKKIIKPEKEADFMKSTKDERLTLITCYPPTSTAMRLIVIGKPSPFPSH